MCSTLYLQLITATKPFYYLVRPRLKCIIISLSRVSEAAVQLVQSQVVPEHVRRGVQSLARWISQSWLGFLLLVITPVYVSLLSLLGISLDQSNMESHVHLDNLFHKVGDWVCIMCVWKL